MVKNLVKSRAGAVCWTLTWLLPQSHDWHHVVRHVKVWKHRQVCQSMSQLVQIQHPEHIHNPISSTLQQHWTTVVNPRRRKATGPQSIRARVRLHPPSVKCDTSPNSCALLPSCSQLVSWLRGFAVVAGQQISVGRGRSSPSLPPQRRRHGRIGGIPAPCSAMAVMWRAEPERLCDWRSRSTASQSGPRGWL